MERLCLFLERIRTPIRSSGAVYRKVSPWQTPRRGFSVVVKRLDMVGERLVSPTVALVLARMGQKITVKLLDVVLGERNRLPMSENSLHNLGVADELLLVAGLEMTQSEIG